LLKKSKIERLRKSREGELLGLPGFSLWSFYLRYPPQERDLHERYVAELRDVRAAGSLGWAFPAGKLAPDMWTDGRRMYFDFGGKSYSLATDLEGARRRKNQLLAEATTISAKVLK
jgi:hypothetical protein